MLSWKPSQKGTVLRLNIKNLFGLTEYFSLILKSLSHPKVLVHFSIPRQSYLDLLEKF